MHKQWLTFCFGYSKIIVDGDRSHEIKRRLLLGRKIMTNLDQHIKKQRHYFADKGPSSECYGFSSGHVWMWELDYKEAECWRIDAFELWCWRRLWRVPWTTRRSNQSILSVHWKDWCWSWNSNILATWCEKLTYLKRPWCWERLRAGREGDKRGWDGWMASLTQWTWV